MKRLLRNRHALADPRTPTIDDDRKPALGHFAGIGRFQRASRQIPRMGERLLSIGFAPGVDPRELGVVDIDLPAQFTHAGIGFAVPSSAATRRSSRGSVLIVRTLSVTSSPSVPLPPRDGTRQPAPLVGQADRQAIVLRLDHEDGIAATQTLGPRRHKSCATPPRCKPCRG